MDVIYHMLSYKQGVGSSNPSAPTTPNALLDLRISKLPTLLATARQAGNTEC